MSKKKNKDEVELLDANGNPLNSDSLKNMKYHYKMSKKAWKKANRRAAWPLRIILTLMVLAIAFTGYKLYEKQQGAEVVEENLQSIPVTITQVELTDMMTTYKGNGDVSPSSTVDVYPDTPSGKVTRINVELGDQVVKDQILMWIDPSRPGQTYAQSPVKAPVSGTITSLSPTVGAMVSAQMPLASIGDLSNLEVITHIPEKYVSSVSLGQEALISLIDWQDEYISGRITEISPVVDSTSRTLKVIISLNQRDVRVKAGMFVRVSMVTERFPQVPALPTEAIIERFDDQFVYVVSEDNSQVERRNIVSTLTIEGISRIEEGLEIGETVVVMGNNLLEDGSSINVIEDVE